MVPWVSKNFVLAEANIEVDRIYETKGNKITFGQYEIWWMLTPSLVTSQHGLGYK